MRSCIAMPERASKPQVLDEAYQAFLTGFPETVLEATRERGELRARIRKEDLLEALRYFKSEHNFLALVDIVALDRLHETEAGGRRFRLIYQICRFPEHVRLHLAVDVGEGEAAPSAVSVFKAADWAEREVFDMFGIRFDGHPGLQRIYLPEEFEGFPLRKDFPLEGRSRGV